MNSWKSILNAASTGICKRKSLDRRNQVDSGQFLRRDFEVWVPPCYTPIPNKDKEVWLAKYIAACITSSLQAESCRQIQMRLIYSIVPPELRAVDQGSAMIAATLLLLKEGARRLEVRLPLVLEQGIL